MLASLAAGLPSVLVPQGADQFENAMRCAELGTSLALMPDELTAASLHEAVGRVLDERSFTERALAIAAEIETLPDPHSVAKRLAST